MMLRMSLKDFVLVDALEIEFLANFAVLTGETGAGKSILIDALQFVLGARADAGSVRQGRTRAEVSAEFLCSDSIRAWLDASGFTCEESVLIRRTVDIGGKSRAWINSSATTASQMRELGDMLVDIHGQHGWQSLLRPASSRALLDAYGQIDTHSMRLAWDTWRTAGERLRVAQAKAIVGDLERDRLNWQIAEVQRLAPGACEWEELNVEHTRLSHAQGLIDAAQSATNCLSEGENNAADLVHRAIQGLNGQAGLEPQFRSHLETLAAGLAQLTDVSHELRTYLRRLEPNPARLVELDARLAQWIGLARKNRKAPEDLAQALAGWQLELFELSADSNIEALQKIEQENAAKYRQNAQIVSEKRRNAAIALAAAITEAMQTLGMKGGKFEVILIPRSMPDKASSHGLEDVDFLVAGHAGSTPKPVSKVASGGELSRIALSIAVCTSRLGSTPTLVFDEVDSGIGGAVAETVGRMMKQLAIDRQVLCVTHLPQVAACADHHALVSKVEGVMGVTSRARWVCAEERVSEIARMLGGEKLSGTTMAHAKEMLGS